MRLTINDAAAITKPLETKKMPTSVEIEIMVAGEGHTITAIVQYQYYKGYSGGVEYPGGPRISPSEPAHIELESIIYWHDQKPVDLEFMLTKDQIRAIENELLENYDD